MPSKYPTTFVLSLTLRHWVIRIMNLRFALNLPPFIGFWVNLGRANIYFYILYARHKQQARWVKFTSINKYTSQPRAPRQHIYLLFDTISIAIKHTFNLHHWIQWNVDCRVNNIMFPGDNNNIPYFLPGSTEKRFRSHCAYRFKHLDDICGN